MPFLGDTNEFAPPVVPGLAEAPPLQRFEQERALEEIQENLRRLQSILNEYEDREIIDLTGERYRVLAKPTGSADAAVQVPFPFEIVPNAAGEVATFYLRPGVIGGNIDPSVTESTPEYSGTSLDEFPSIPVTSNGTKYVYAKVTVDPISEEVTVGTTTVYQIASAERDGQWQIELHDSEQSGTAPEINISTGTATAQGVYYKRIGLVQRTTTNGNRAVEVLSQTRVGNWGVTFCPNTLALQVTEPFRVTAEVTVIEAT